MQSAKNPKMAIENHQIQKTIKSLHSSSSSSASSSVPLSSEIIVEILSRLPVESLLRCKSVCKSWRSLISDLHFIKYHLTLSTTNHHYTHHRLLLSNYADLKTCSLYDVMYDHHLINPLEVDYPIKKLSKIVSIIGSCNGLICLTIDTDNVFIWNPSTRKSIHLPGRPRSGFVLCGFGYNESSDDYKVVEITFSSLRDTNDNVVMVYSSKNGNWKEIGGFPHSIWFRDSDVFLNGALHWIASIDIDSWIIVSLDLAKETYGQFLLPVDDHEVDMDLKFGILGDCLCVLYDYGRSSSSRFCADVWVMKVYGVKDSWFKLVSIPYDLVTGFEKYYWGVQFSVPLCVSDDGKILLRLESSLVVFNSKEGSALEIQKFDVCYNVCTFVESLVSPVGMQNLI